MKSEMNANMGNFEFIMPQMGEGLIEATVTKWLKQEGDTVTEDESLVEVATDKVDTEIPSPVTGVLVKKMCAEGEVVPIGHTLAMIEVEGLKAAVKTEPEQMPQPEPVKKETSPVVNVVESNVEQPEPETSSVSRFYSPLVKNIAKQENIPMKELASIPGSGKDDRLTKEDILNYIRKRKKGDHTPAAPAVPVVPSGDDQVIEMDRIRQLIASHMSRSWETSPHVNSFVEIDMTNIVHWREKNKSLLEHREEQKLTFTPFFIEAIAKSVRDVPYVNVSMDGTKIILRRNINIGMAVALPNNNLIVPVIRNADQKSLLGITRTVNDLSNRARIGKLVPDDITGGTISITNLGSVGLIMGTPIINQPQAAIIAVGSIIKRPVVIESPDGDAIAIRHMMILSLAHDHRIIDGALAGQFLNRMKFYLEKFDINQSI